MQHRTNVPCVVAIIVVLVSCLVCCFFRTWNFGFLLLPVATRVTSVPRLAFFESQVPEVARAAPVQPHHLRRTLWRFCIFSTPSVTCLLYFIRCSGNFFSRHLLECTNYVARVTVYLLNYAQVLDCLFKSIRFHYSSGSMRLFSQILTRRCTHDAGFWHEVAVRKSSVDGATALGHHVRVLNEWANLYNELILIIVVLLIFLISLRTFNLLLHTYPCNRNVIFFTVF